MRIQVFGTINTFLYDFPFFKTLHKVFKDLNPEQSGWGGFRGEKKRK